nr:2-methylisoborneol synthase-like isoform X2 [Camelus dromedarius]
MSSHDRELQTRGWGQGMPPQERAPCPPRPQPRAPSPLRAPAAGRVRAARRRPLTPGSRPPVPAPPPPPPVRGERGGRVPRFPATSGLPRVRWRRCPCKSEIHTPGEQTLKGQRTRLPGRAQVLSRSGQDRRSCVPDLLPARLWSLWGPPSCARGPLSV